MGLLDEIKNQVKRSGTNKGKFLYFKEGAKIRVRFLQDMEDGMKVLFHDSFAEGINIPCQSLVGKRCSHCDSETLRHRDQYMWSVWDYEAKEVKILLGAVNNASPIPLLAGFYESYGNLTDRDYVITQNGKGTQKSFSVVPMDKVKFRNDKAKAFSNQKALQLLDKAFPDDNATDDDEEEEKPKAKAKAPVKKKETKVEDMTAKELYALCIEKDLDAEPKKSQQYYLDLLEEANEEDEESEDEEVDYDSMSAKELYKLCKDKDLDVETKKPNSYYIKKLKEADENEDDWGDEDESEDDEWK